MARRMAAVDSALSDPAAADRWVESIATALSIRLANTCRWIKRTGKVGADDGRVFRWHDAGDLQSALHLELIVRVAELTPGVKHWLPTRESGHVREYLAQGRTFPENLTVRVSLARIGAAVSPSHCRLLEASERIALSGVHDADRPMAHGFTECTAYQRDGACEACRACWDPRKDVSYPLH
jgi:hypothetical protein